MSVVARHLRVQVLALQPTTQPNRPTLPQGLLAELPCQTVDDATPSQWPPISLLHLRHLPKGRHYVLLGTHGIARFPFPEIVVASLRSPLLQY